MPVVICNGTQDGELLEAARDGAVGTRFKAQAEGRLSPYKLWLKHAKQPSGTIEVDRGADQLGQD